MAGQLYWEDIEKGDEVVPVSKVASTRTLVKWAGASGDFAPLHYQDSFAASQGIGRPIIHGALKKAWLADMIVGWIGKDGMMRRLSCQYRGMDWPRQMRTLTEPEEGETWWCKGRVTNKYIEGKNHYVDCEIWLENGKGEKTVTGSATVVLPSKKAKVSSISGIL